MHTGSQVQGNARDRDSSGRALRASRGSPSRSTARAPGAEDSPVSKTVVTIAGIGVAGCVLLAAMMKQLVQHQQAQRDATDAGAVGARFASRLAAPLALREEHEGMRVRLVAHARAAPGEDRQQLADAVAAALWRQCAAGERIAEVEVVVRADDGSAVTARAPRPAPPR
jgi:hypothetical protein